MGMSKDRGRLEASRDSRGDVDHFECCKSTWVWGVTAKNFW